MRGAKLDLKKCFDSVAPFQAIRCWEQLGSPAQVKMLKDVYQSQQRWVECEGVVHLVPLKPTLSLLQGCPASPALLAGLMTVWMMAAQGKNAPENPRGSCENEVQVGIHIDDRTLWVETPKRRVRKAVQKLKEFVERGDKADKVLGWELHPDRGEWAATKRCGQLWLRNWDTILGQIKAEIKVLASRTTSQRTDEGQPIRNNGQRCMCEIGQNPQTGGSKNNQVQSHPGTRDFSGHVAWSVAAATQDNAHNIADQNC